MAERLRGRRGVEQRKRRLARTHGLCEWCMAKGVTALATQVDHIVPLSQGGADEDSNTRNLCDRHHRDATAQQFGHGLKVNIGRWGWPTR